MDRRAFLKAGGVLLGLVLSGCGSTTPVHPQDSQDIEASEASSVTIVQEDQPMQIMVTVNDVPFTATIEDSTAGRELLARLPLTLQMQELHGNEKYCYTDEGFGGESSVPESIEAGDLMVFGSDCLVLFYESFANGGWSYQGVGKIDDPAGLAEACGTGTATVAFAALT